MFPPKANKFSPATKKTLPPPTLRVRRKKKAERSEEAAKQAVAAFWAKKDQSQTSVNNTANPYAQAEAFNLERNAERSLQSYEDD